MNTLIISSLSELREYHQKNTDNPESKFKAMAYSKAIQALKQYFKTMPEEIESAEEISGIKGIGPKMSNKIDELIQTGKIIELEEIRKTKPKKSTKQQTLEEFQKVYAIGPANAKKLYEEHGIHSMNALVKESKKKNSILTHAQKVGIRYMEPLQERIPRKYIEAVTNKINQIMQETLGDCYEMVTAGSYRRGKAESGDVDLMICNNGEFTLQGLAEILIGFGIVVEILALDKKKFMGVGTLTGTKDKQRFYHLDVYMVQRENWWPALVTHTGPKELNTQMRAKAASMGMRLSDQGLVVVKSTKKTAEQTTEQTTKKVKLKSEKDLFDVLEMKYEKPTNR